MANLTKWFRTGYGVQINYTINSQSISNNTTNVTVKAQLISGGSSYTISSSATKNGTLSINGKDYSFTFTASLSGNQTKTLYTKTLDIPHNSNGTKTLSLGISLGINVTLTGTYWSTVSHSDTVALSTIPRTSSMSLSTTSATLGSTSVTVTINRASADFTHNVYCKIGSYSVKVNPNKEGETSILFTPELAIANQITTSTSGSATIEVQTYNGATKLGSVTKSLTVNIPSSMTPTIGSFTDTKVAAGAATSYGYVKGLSKCTLTMGSVTGSYGSSIVSYSISGGGFSGTASSLATGILNNAGSITFTAKVTDSRGRTATATIPITVWDYSVPSISSFSARRCNSGGTIIDDGTYVSALATYSYSSVNNQNTVSTSVQYKKSTTTTWATGVAASSNVAKVIGGGTISADSSFDIMITVSDKFNSVSKTVVVPTAYAIVDILKGGKGMAIGKIAETSNLLDIGMSVKLGSNVTISDTSKSNLVGGTGLPGTTQVTDFNKIWQSGFYESNGGANTPFSSWNWLIHAGHTSNNSGGSYNYGMQIAAQNSTNNFAIRTTNNLGVGTWNTLYHTGNKPSAYDVGAYARSEWDSSKGTNGYCKFPTGVIIQWGSVLITPSAAGTITSAAVAFPIAFPSACRTVQVTPSSAVPDKLTQSASGISASGFSVYMTRTNTTETNYYWFAAGY